MEGFSTANNYLVNKEKFFYSLWTRSSNVRVRLGVRNTNYVYLSVHFVFGTFNEQ